jgi:hypothetical protein
MSEPRGSYACRLLFHTCTSHRLVKAYNYRFISGRRLSRIQTRLIWPLSLVLVLFDTPRYELCWRLYWRIAVSCVATVVVTSKGTVSAIPTTVVSEVGRKRAHWIDKDLKFQTWLQFFWIQVGHQVSE